MESKLTDKERKKLGYCKRCGGPVFWNLEVDSNGYKVRSFRCWNGHYKDLTILSLSQIPGTCTQKIKFIPHTCPKCGGSFNFIQRIPTLNGKPIPIHGICRNCENEYTITLYVQNGNSKPNHQGKKYDFIRRATTAKRK